MGTLLAVSIILDTRKAALDNGAGNGKLEGKGARRESPSSTGSNREHKCVVMMVKFHFKVIATPPLFQVPKVSFRGIAHARLSNKPYIKRKFPSHLFSLVVLWTPQAILCCFTPKENSTLAVFFLIHLCNNLLVLTLSATISAI